MVQKFGELFENVQQSKSILKKNNVPADHEDYLALRGMLEKTPGWTGLFTKFRFEDNVPVEELAVLYDRLLALQPLLSRLPQGVDRYTDVEKLGDDLERLESAHKGKKLLKELNKEQQAQFARLPASEQQRLEAIATAFYKLPGDDQRGFTRKLRSLSGASFLDALEAYVEAHGTGFTFSQVRASVQDTPGAVVRAADEDAGFLVVELEKYEACEALSGATNWCIRNSRYYWDSYVGYDKNARQYTIYNFNVPLSDIHSMCGVTVGYQRRGVGAAREYDDYDSIRNAHWKNDDDATRSSLPAYYGQAWKPLEAVLKGIAPEEYQRREKGRELRNQITRLTSVHTYTPEQKETLPARLTEIYNELFTEFPGSYSVPNLMQHCIRLDAVDLFQASLEREPIFRTEEFHRDSFSFVKSGGVQNLLTYAFTEKAPRILDYIMSTGIDRFDSTVAVQAAKWLADHDQYERIYPMYSRYVGGATAHNILGVLIKSDDLDVLGAFLNTKPQMGADGVMEMARMYFTKRDADPAFLPLLKAAVADYAERFRSPLSIVNLIAIDSDDYELFMRELAPVKDKVRETEEGHLTMFLLRHGDYAEADRFIEQFSRSSGGGLVRFIHKLAAFVIEEDSHDIALHLLKTGTLTIVEFASKDKGSAQFLIDLYPALRRAGFTPSSDELIDATQEIVLGTKEELLEEYATAILPFASAVTPDLSGVLGLLLYVTGQNKTLLPAYLGAQPGYTLLPESQEIECVLTDFEAVGRLYNFPGVMFEPNVFDTSTYDVEIHPCRFDDEWNLLSEENLATLNELLRQRGYAPEKQPHGALLILRRFLGETDGTYYDPNTDDYEEVDDSDFDGDWQLDQDEDDEDDDEDDKPTGVDCTDVVMTLARALFESYREDTLSAAFKNIMGELKSVFNFNEATFMRANDDDETEVVVRFPLRWVRENADLYTVRSTHRGFDVLALVEAALHQDRQGLNGNTHVRPEITAATYNEHVAEALRRLKLL